MARGPFPVSREVPSHLVRLITMQGCTRERECLASPVQSSGNFGWSRRPPLSAASFSGRRDMWGPYRRGMACHWHRASHATLPLAPAVLVSEAQTTHSFWTPSSKQAKRTQAAASRHRNKYSWTHTPKQYNASARYSCGRRTKLPLTTKLGYHIIESQKKNHHPY